MKKTINGVLLNTLTNTVAEHSLDYEKNDNGKTNFLPKIYSLLNCSLIDIIYRKFGDLWADIVVDDEGLLQEHLIPSVYTFDKTTKKALERIVGNVFICSHNEDGELVSLSDKEIKTVLNQVYSIEFEGENRKVLVANL